jgi:DNA-binding NarL/FixJ family response regulator
MCIVDSELTPIPENRDKKTVLIADDHPLFVKAIRDILEAQDDIVIVAEAHNGEEAVRQAVEWAPNVVIMDISMPVLNGIEATKQIKAQCAKTAVLVLTVHEDVEHILGILEAGADGYLTKTIFADEVVTAVRSAAAGETVMESKVFKQVLKHTIRYPSNKAFFDDNINITTRESEVLKLASKGLSNKEISLKLGLSLRTIKGYMVEIFSKLHAKSRTEAVIIGLRKGLITPDDIEIE